MMHYPDTAHMIFSHSISKRVTQTLTNIYHYSELSEHLRLLIIKPSTV